jgi:hypothetical protein
MPVWAGSWSTPVVLANNAYSGSVALDSAGNMVAVWNLDSPTLNEIQASTAAFGHPWSAPVNLSGTITGAGNPIVHSSATGNATAIFTNNSGAGATLFADHPHGGNWSTAATMNGVNQFFVSNDNGDQGLAWGTGTSRTASNTVGAVVRLAGGAWSAVTTLASGAHFVFDGATMGPDGTMAVAWESYNSVCGSRVCKTSNWVLHVSTLAHGSQTWVDSGALLGPDATQHFSQLAADGVADLGVVALSGGNIVSLVRHGSAWTAPAVIASTSAVGFNTGTGRDNRIFATDISGHATLVGWGPGLFSLVAVDGNLTTNTWGKVTTISGSDQNPGYFDYAMSESGAAIVFWWTSGTNSNTTWRAATRSGPGVAWNAPATVGTSFDAGGVPESVAINSAGQAAVVFHGYSSDFLTYIEYTTTYPP